MSMIAMVSQRTTTGLRSLARPAQAAVRGAKRLGVGITGFGLMTAAAASWHWQVGLLAAGLSVFLLEHVNEVRK